MTYLNFHFVVTQQYFHSKLFREKNLLAIIFWFLCFRLLISLIEIFLLMLGIVEGGSLLLLNLQLLKYVWPFNILSSLFFFLILIVCFVCINRWWFFVYVLHYQITWNFTKNTISAARARTLVEKIIYCDFCWWNYRCHLILLTLIV